jgi:hypothetical protein
MQQLLQNRIAASTSIQPLEEFVKTLVNKIPSVFEDDSSVKR